MIQVSKVKYKGDIWEAVKGSIDLIGGIQKFIQKGDRVLLKPNFNTADPPPASTSLDFLEAVVRLCYEADAKAVIIGESSTYFLKTHKILEKMGLLAKQEEWEARVINFDEGEWVRREIPSPPAQYIKKASLPEVLNRVDKLIFLPSLKTHRLARFTASLKLIIGFIKPRERIRLHAWNLENKIAELNLLIKPDLVIMDARKCFVTQGPEKGETRQPNLILASTDRVAIDIEGVKILKSYPAKNKLNMPIWDLPQIKRAVELGIGIKSEQDYQVIEASFIAGSSNGRTHGSEPCNLRSTRSPAAIQ